MQFKKKWAVMVVSPDGEAEVVASYHFLEQANKSAMMRAASAAHAVTESIVADHEGLQDDPEFYHIAVPFVTQESRWRAAKHFKGDLEGLGQIWFAGTQPEMLDTGFLYVVKQFETVE